MTAENDYSWQTAVDRIKCEVDKVVAQAKAKGEQAFDYIRESVPMESTRMSVDLIETPDDLLVLANCPGVDPGSIDLTLVGNSLSITAERPEITLTDQDRVHVRERTHGECSRTVVLPYSVRHEGLKAEYQNGVLKVTLPRNESARPVKIHVDAMIETEAVPVS